MTAALGNFQNGAFNTLDGSVYPQFLFDNNRAPTVNDIKPAGTEWLYNGVIYQTTGAGIWLDGGTAAATETQLGSVYLATTAETAAGGAPSASYVSSANDVSAAIAAASFSGSTPATIAQEGVVYLSTNAEAVAGSAAHTNSVLIPGNLASVFAAPPVIGGTTPAAAAFTTSRTAT